MKKLVSLLLVLCLFGGMLAGCGQSASSAAPAAPADSAPADQAPADAGSEPAADDGEVFIMQLGHGQSTTSPRHRTCEMFKEMVEERTNGHVQVEIFPAGQLGNETEMTEAVSMGTLQAIRGGRSDYLPQITLLALPMVCDSMEDVRKVCSSDFVADMLSTVEAEHNMKVLVVTNDNGFHQITNNVRPILSPDDLKGVKMRTSIEVITLAMEAFGASTVSIPFTDLYMALKTNVADGQENPVAMIDAQKFYEVQKYCSIINYQYCAEITYVNLDWWNSLPTEYQDIISECAQIMVEENDRIVEEENEQYIENIKNNGCEVTFLTQEQRESFREPAESVWKQYVESGRVTKEDLVKMLEIVGKTIDW